MNTPLGAPLGKLVNPVGAAGWVVEGPSATEAGGLSVTLRHPFASVAEATVLLAALSPPFADTVVGFIYYFVPNAKVRFRDVWVGAVVTGLLCPSKLPTSGKIAPLLTSCEAKLCRRS